MVERGHFKELENVIKSIPEPPETRENCSLSKVDEEETTDDDDVEENDDE